MRPRASISQKNAAELEEQLKRPIEYLEPEFIFLNLYTYAIFFFLA